MSDPPIQFVVLPLPGPYTGLRSACQTCKVTRNYGNYAGKELEMDREHPGEYDKESGNAIL